ARPAQPNGRAARACLAFHDEVPGVTAWNEQAQRFEYRDRNDPAKVMLELRHEGLIHYVPAKADSLRPGEVVAVPFMPTSRMSVHAAAAWLDMDEDGDGAAVTPEWRPQAIVCSACGVAQVQARTFAGRVECRCPSCGSSSTGTLPRLSSRVLSTAVAAHRPGDRADHNY
ncbi:hypothetical protein, partial [Methylobacterium soli]|uniref:hypothetical protein n=1 Tax=Methylobacterium soli TaxID=553447 RepID=UPI001EE1C007